MPQRHTRLWLGAIVLTLASGAVPAAAHPFGPPLTADLTATGATVAVQWRAAEDDWVALGRYVGAFEPAPGEQLTGFELILRSTEVRDYLLEHITISQAGVPCTGAISAVPDSDSLVRDGMPLRFECGSAIEVVDVQVTVLTDVHEAYRTVVTGNGFPGQSLYTLTSPAQQWDFTAEDGRPVGMLVALGLALVGGAVAAGVAFIRRAVPRSQADATAEMPMAR